MLSESLRPPSRSFAGTRHWPQSPGSGTVNSRPVLSTDLATAAVLLSARKWPTLISPTCISGICATRAPPPQQFFGRSQTIWHFGTGHRLGGPQSHSQTGSSHTLRQGCGSGHFSLQSGSLQGLEQCTHSIFGHLVFGQMTAQLGFSQSMTHLEMSGPEHRVSQTGGLHFGRQTSSHLGSSHSQLHFGAQSSDLGPSVPSIKLGGVPLKVSAYAPPPRVAEASWMVASLWVKSSFWRAASFSWASRNSFFWASRSSFLWASKSSFWIISSVDSGNCPWASDRSLSASDSSWSREADGA